ncbi:MAG: molybdenum cofactor guanylyltransferase [Anaerolineae bacterium]|jgi:molybdopterin-guanine dinucleotide biosynthesis protein A|nr:molybdenum cofactor guanylyltransferase [Anaerolineae bacterium]
MREVSCAVLAGGTSSRFGSDKALLQVDGQMLIQRVVARLSKISNDVLIVGNNLGRFEGVRARLVEDRVQGAGALGGVYTAVEACRHPYVFCAACDMPFLDLNLIRYMVLLAPGYDVVIPYVRGEPEPLHAVYAKACAPAIKAALDAGERRIISFLAQVRVRDVREDEIRILDPDLHSFFNLNVPEDLARMQAILEAHKTQA